MLNFRHTSIQAKLTRLTMLTSGVALLVSVTLFGFNDVRTFRQSMERDLQTLADVIGASATSALDFDDATSAAKTLAALERKPGILSAAIYKKDDSALATYLRSVRRGFGRNSLRPDQGAPGAVQPPEQRQQIHRARNDHFESRARTRRG